MDTDQYLTVPEAQKVLLSSAMKLITPGVFDLVKAAKDGKFPTAATSTARWAWPRIHDLDSKVPADVKAKIAGDGQGHQERIDQDQRPARQAVVSLGTDRRGSLELRRSITDCVPRL